MMGATHKNIIEKLKILFKRTLKSHKKCILLIKINAFLGGLALLNLLKLKIIYILIETHFN